MDFDFARFGFPNAGNTGKVPPKKVNTEKTENVAAPEVKDIGLTSKKAEASALDATAAQNFGFVRSAKPIPITDAAELQALTKLADGIDPARLERCMKSVNETIYNRTGEAAKEGMDFALNIGTQSNAITAMRDFESKMAGTSYNFNEQDALNQFMEEAYA